MKKHFTSLLLACILNIGYHEPLHAQTPDEEGLFIRRFTYTTLSPLQKKLFDDFVEDAFPNGKKVDEILNEGAGARDKMRLAEALFFRHQKEDISHAITIIEWIISLQDTVSAHQSFGNWKGSLNAKEYDENMREFIGTDLIIVYHKFKSILPADVRNKIETALIRAAKGDFIRNVKADYNNISIMSAFMQDYIGHVFHLPAIQQNGLNKAKEILSHFQQYHTLCEYNSPTYYGVDFTGLALWREMAISPEFKAMGKILEKELWLDVAAFYNANLQNICGPFLRSYGIDMKKYTAITGVWIAAAVDDASLATVPAREGPHNESNFIATIFDLGISMPQKALNEFRKFSQPRFLSRITPNYYEGDKLKKVTANIQTNWMMGGLWGNRKISHILKTGTMHWKSADGDIGWLYIPGEGKTNVRVDDTKMDIYLADPDATNFEILLYAKNSTVSALEELKWSLSPMEMDIHTTLERRPVEIMSKDSLRDNIESDMYYPYAYKIVYEIPKNWNKDIPLISIRPNYHELKTGN